LTLRVEDICARVGEHGFFFRKEDGVVGGKTEEGVLAENLYIFAAKRSLDAVGDSLRVRAKNDGITAIHFQFQFVVALADFCELLTDDRFEGFVYAVFLVPFTWGFSPSAFPSMFIPNVESFISNRPLSETSYVIFLATWMATAIRLSGERSE